MSIRNAWLESVVDRVDREPQPPLRSGRVVAFDRVVMEATGVTAPAGAIMSVGDGPDAMLAEAAGFRGDRLLLVPLSRAASIEPGLPVRT